MATVSLIPVNVVSGQSVPVLPQGQAIAYGSVACVIYNSTQNILIVRSSSGTRYLQPLQADVYSVNDAFPVPIITPISTLATGVFLGTITSTFYDKNDGAPLGFPQPLQDFPGGSNIIQSSPMSGLTFTENSSAVSPLIIATYQLIAPTGYLIITFQPISRTGSVVYTIAVNGVQTGLSYGSVSISENAASLPGLTTLTIPIAPGNLDFTYQLRASYTSGAGSVTYSILTSVATPQLPIPTFPTLAYHAAGSNASAIVASAGAAPYLFGVDFVLGGAAADALSVNFGGVTIAQLGATGGANASFVDHAWLNGHRCPGTVGVSVGIGTSTVTIRYALGP